MNIFKSATSAGDATNTATELQGGIEAGKSSINGAIKEFLQ